MAVLTSAPGDLILTITENEGIDGNPPRTMTFSEFELRPLSFELLQEVRLHQTIQIPIEAHNARITHTNIHNAPTHVARMTAKLDSVFTSESIGLVPEGWLPSGLASHRAGTVVMIDRNIVGKIVSRFDSGAKKGRKPDFLDRFGDFPVCINPILYVMEGNARSTPTRKLMEDQLVEVVGKLQRALPKANLLVGPDTVAVALELIETTRSAMEQAQNFLLQISPLLKAPVSRKKFETRWNNIIRVADACGVERSSLVVLAALSTVAIPNGGSPARRLLKFKNSYTASDAYNALADIRSLEMLMTFFSIYPDERMQLCTADRNLALFWTGILAHNFRREGSETAYTVAPLEGILPEEACEKWQKCVLTGMS